MLMTKMIMETTLRRRMLKTEETMMKTKKTRMMMTLIYFDKRNIVYLI